MPDLSNLVELGTALDSLTSDQLKNFQKTLAVGVTNEIIVRALGRTEFGFSKTTDIYGGALQRIVVSKLLDAQDSHLLNLENGQSYLDGKFYGVDVDARVYEDTKAFKVVYSVSDDTFRNYFNNASDLVEWFARIAIVAENSINKKLNAWEQNLLARVIMGGNKVSVVELFNKEINGKEPTDNGYQTIAEIIADKDSCIRFDNYTKAIMEVLESRISDVTIGDGLTTPAENVRLIVNQKFESFMRNLATSYMFNPSTLPTHKTVNAWNVNENISINDNGTTKNYTTNIVGGAIDKSNANFLAYVKNGASNKEAEYEEGVIAVLYDSDCAGIKLRADKVTVEEVGAEGFRNLHHHIAMNMYCDERFKTIVLTL